MLLKYSAGFLFILFASINVINAQETFTNPIADWGQDPWVVQKDGYYYYCFSSNNGVAVSKSSDLISIGSAERVQVWQAPADTSYSRDIWAPELHYLEGKWYIYFAADDGANENHRMYVLEGSSQDPQGDYVLKGKVAAITDRWAIDGTVLETNAGELYFVWSGWEHFVNGRQDLYIARMSNPWTIDNGEFITKVEAEDCLINNAEARGATGASNGECAAYIDYADSYLEFSATVEQAGKYLLKACFGNGSSDVSTHLLTVNGASAGSLVYSVSGWDNWSATSAEVTLTEGDNTIRVSKGDNYAELDYFELYFGGNDRLWLSSPDTDWETISNPPLINEGPEILKKGENIFIIYSADGSWTDEYCLGMLTWKGGSITSDTSWQKSDGPVFAKTETVFGPGHASFVKSPDYSEDWIVYHSARESGSGWDRIVNAQPFSWTAEGYPDFGDPVGPGVELNRPSEDQVAADNHKIPKMVSGYEITLFNRLITLPAEFMRKKVAMRVFDLRGREIFKTPDISKLNKSIPEIKSGRFGVCVIRLSVAGKEAACKMFIDM